MIVLRSIPLLAFPTLVYALIAIPMSVEEVRATLDAPFFTMALPSGDVWTPEWGHVLTAASAILLMVEVVKSARAATSSLIENALALLLFTLQLIVFLLVGGFGTTDFAAIMTMTLIDFMAGAMVMIYSSRRDVQYNVQH